MELARTRKVGGLLAKLLTYAFELKTKTRQKNAPGSKTIVIVTMIRSNQLCKLNNSKRIELITFNHQILQIKLNRILVIK